MATVKQFEDLKVWQDARQLRYLDGYDSNSRVKKPAKRSAANLQLLTSNLQPS